MRYHTDTVDDFQLERFQAGYRRYAVPPDRNDMGCEDEPEQPNEEPEPPKP
jgi:hypothetical protein